MPDRKVRGGRDRTKPGLNTQLCGDAAEGPDIGAGSASAGERGGVRQLLQLVQLVLGLTHMCRRKSRTSARVNVTRIQIGGSGLLRSVGHEGSGRARAQQEYRSGYPLKIEPFRIPRVY